MSRQQKNEALILDQFSVPQVMVYPATFWATVVPLKGREQGEKPDNKAQLNGQEG